MQQDHGVVKTDFCRMTLLIQRIQGLFNGGNDSALDPQRFALDARAGSGRVAAAAELGGNFIYVHAAAFGAKTDAGQFRFEFLKNASDHNRSNCADMIDQPFGITAFGP